MSQTTAAAFLDLVNGRRGHFQLESGHHSGLWLDLDALFAEPLPIAPFVAALASALRPHTVSAVCGPLLGGAFLAQLVAHALAVEFCFTERDASPARRPLSGALPSAGSVRRTSTREARGHG